MSIKVFCGECRYVKTSMKVGYMYRCTKVKTSYLIPDTPISKAKEEFIHGDCYEVNKLNDCKEFSPISFIEAEGKWVNPEYRVENID